LRFLAAGVFILCASVANAGVIVSDFGPGQTYDNTDGGFVINSTNRVAVSFTPTTTSQFGSLEIAAYLSWIGPTSNLVVALAADSSGLPGVGLETFSFAPGAITTPASSGNKVLTGTSVLNPILTAGTQYWIVVSTSTTNTGYGWGVNSLSSQQFGVEEYSGGTWSYNGDMLTPAFEVDSLDPAPEPGAGGLLGAGLLALVAMRLRSARA
jgi:hypothetical protein